MKKLIATGLVAAWFSVFVDGAAAQMMRRMPDRPYRALFGGEASGAEGQSLDMSAVVVEAYDDNLLAEGGAPTPGVATLSGRYTMLQANGDYAWTTQRVQLGITGASAFRYYGQVGDLISVSQNAGLGLSTELAKRLTLAVNESFAYSPSYLSRLFPGVTDVRLGDAPPASPNYAVTDTSSYVYVTAVSLKRGVARHGEVILSGDYTFTDFNGGAVLRKDGMSYGGAAEFRRRVGRHSEIGTSYHYRTGDYGFEAVGKTTEHSLGFAFEHTQVLSATRSALYSLNIGASSLIVPPVTIAGGELPRTVVTATDRLYRFTADGTLSYQFRRTGEFRASYHRGAEFVVELTQPVFLDGVALSVSASPSRRVDLIAGGGYSKGVTLLQQTSRFDTYTGNVTGRYHISPLVSAYAEYVYYFYDFANNPLLAPTLPARLERNGVRAGVMFSAPFVRR